jgi:hypothetical protein
MAGTHPDGGQKRQPIYQLQGLLLSAAFLLYQHLLLGVDGMRSFNFPYGERTLDKIPFMTMIYNFIHNGCSATE